MPFGFVTQGARCRGAVKEHVMTRHARRRAAIATLMLGFAAAQVTHAQRRPIAEKDLFKFVWVADPQISPDGTQVAFVRVTIDEKKDAYESAIWIARTDGSEAPRAFTSGIRDTSPRWAPDGRRLAFVRAVEKDGRVQPPQVHVIAMAGGEPWAVTDVPRGAGSPDWSPDGRTLLFTSTARADDLTAKPAGEQPRQSDVRVITEAVYRANGVAGFGYVDRDRPSHIWTIAVPSATGEKSAARPLTSGEFGAGNPRWSRDGARVFFVSDRRKESYYHPRDSDLYAVSKDGGEPVRVVSIEGSIGAYAISPDGRQVAFAGSIAGAPERSYSQPDLWVADLAGGPARNLTASYDFDVNGGLGGDQRAPRGQSPNGPIWSRDGRTITIVVGEQGNSNLKRIDVATGKVEPLTRGSNDVMSYTADAAAQKIAYVLSSATTIGNLQVLDAASQAAPRALTSFNDDLLKDVGLTEPEEIWFTSFDGKRIQGWILKPPAFDPSKKYPLILQIHGGPHSAYGNTFTHEFHWMAAKGYVILYTNPRGSSNYGQDFGNVIQYNYPGDDARDILAGVDEILKKGYVDENRLGVTGGSGGGLLTNWIVTQTTRFKAAVSQRDISDWSNFWYTADFTLFTPTWFKKAPFEDPADFARRSPITRAAKIQTPLMFILGDEDWRTPPAAGGEELFRALKYLKRPTVMVRFPNENHELSRSGKPWHRVERLQHIVGWFDKYLMGKDAGTYDSPNR
jgi:dipeptidyl aminopeptidase/acylaminoacyl peptidase